MASDDTVSMETKHTAPILAAVQRMHSEDDQRSGMDPYNTARHRALRLQDINSPAQRAEADAILKCFETELSL